MDCVVQLLTLDIVQVASLFFIGVEVVQLLGSQGFWQHQVLRGVGG